MIVAVLKHFVFGPTATLTPVLCGTSEVGSYGSCISSMSFHGCMAAFCEPQYKCSRHETHDQFGSQASPGVELKKKRIVVEMRSGIQFWVCLAKVSGAEAPRPTLGGDHVARVRLSFSKKPPSLI